MVVLRPHGSKITLWLIHPGVDEVLVFFGSAGFIVDRPVCALRARRFADNEQFFEDIPDIVHTYQHHIKKIQPNGLYAIAEYSFCPMLDFEVTRRLEVLLYQVKFLGSIDLPPYQILHASIRSDRGCAFLWVLSISLQRGVVTGIVPNHASQEQRRCDRKTDAVGSAK